MEIPDPDKKSSSEEDDFKKMLDLSDVWVILLNANGMFCFINNTLDSIHCFPQLYIYIYI